MKVCKLVKVTNPTDRITNKEKLVLANQIRDKHSIQLQSNSEGVISNHGNKVELKAYFENYKKKDKTNVEGEYKVFSLC